MNPYRHTVQYYETDQMGIVHHSNYIRWMEEARIDFLRQLGWDYAKLEQAGILSPVIAVDCRYLSPAHFPDEVLILVQIEEFHGVRLKLSYKMTGTDGKAVCEAHSEHCFVNASGRPIRLRNEFPEFYTALLAQLPLIEG